MFDQLVISRKMPKTRRRWSVALAVALQGLIVAVLLLIPLLFTSALPQTMLGTFLTAPPPPPPPPPPAPKVQQVQRPKLSQVVKTNAFVAPTVIPKKIDTTKESAPPQVANDSGDGVPGGVGNGVPGGIGNMPAPPPPPKAATPQRIRVGGNVEAAKLVRKVTPTYPPIAQTAHVQGTVVLHAIIAKDGSVRQVQYISGPSLLLTSAMQAVRQWKYEPTELNGQPVEVDTTIQVVYSMAG